MDGQPNDNVKSKRVFRKRRRSDRPITDRDAIRFIYREYLDRVCSANQEPQTVPTPGADPAFDAFRELAATVQPQLDPNVHLTDQQLHLMYQTMEAFVGDLVQAHATSHAGRECVCHGPGGNGTKRKQRDRRETGNGKSSPDDPPSECSSDDQDHYDEDRDESGGSAANQLQDN